MLTDAVSKSSKFAIYGAQVVAYGAYVAIDCLLGRKPECFIVSGAAGNPDEIDGVAVVAVDDCEFKRENVLILVAVTELLQDEICAVLDNKGYRNYIRIGAHEEHELMSAYFKRIGMFQPLEPSVGSKACDFAVYEVRNDRDKPLVSAPMLKAWEHPIQAGADVADMRVAPLLDNTGVHISAKNRMYCEMTATYWVWKNTSHAWKGICHYRRHLVISGTEPGDGVIDAVLLLPYICYPNALSHFQRFVSIAVKDAMLSSLQALKPDRYNVYLSILNGRYHYTCNILAARREVFDAYCEWVFEILEHMERSAVTTPEIVKPRALAYTAEALTSLYFLSNSDNLKIRHVEKKIYT